MGLWLHRFELDRVIGRGGMATVWRALDTARGEVVAVKLLRGSRADDEQWIAAFYDEVQAIARLRHPVIVEVFDFGLTPASRDLAAAGIAEATPYYAMEVIDGPLLAAVAPQDWSTARDIVMHLLDGLAHVHARGVIHLDLKPDNIIYDRAASLPRLTDFGIAVFEEDLAEDSHVVVGTPSYMAPEQIRGERWKLGPWTDLYALGALAFWLVCGQKPFQGATDQILRAHLHGERGPFVPRFEVPRGLERWIDRCLAARIVDRFRSAPSAAHALLEEAGHQLRDTPHRLWVQPTEPPRLTTLRFDRSSTPLPGSWEPPRDRLAGLGSGLGVFAVRRPPMVGRRAERSRLWTALTQSADARRPRCVVLRGAAGCGTSFLAEWIGERAVESADVVALDVKDRRQGTDPIRLALLRALRCEENGQDTLARLRDWHELWGEVGPAELWACIELATGTSPDDVHTAALQVLHRMIGREIGYIWCDDVHQSEPTVRFVEQVLDEGRLPALIVCTVDSSASASPEAADALEELYLRPDVELIDVAPLADSQIDELLDGLIDLDDELRARIVARCEGHALFAVQLVGDWIERDWLEHGPGGRLQLTTDVADDLPDGLHALWQRRVEDAVSRAPEPGWAALEIAAALGDRVQRADWSAALQAADVEIDRWFVDRLFARGLIEPAPGGWRFTHGMLRESLVRHASEAGRWADCNRVCAELFATSSDYAGARRHAHHLEQAGEHAALRPALLHAGQAAISEGRHHEAIQTLHHLDALGCGELLGPQRAALAYALSQIHQVDQARRAAEEALDVASATDDRPTLARAYRGLGAALRPRDAAAALDAYRRAIALYREVGNTRGEAHTLASSAWCHIAEGAPERSIELLRAAQQCHLRAGTSDTRIQYSLANVHAEMGDWSAARREVDVVRAENPENPYVLAISDLVAARIHLALGELEHAREAIDRAREWHDATGEFNPEVAIVDGLVSIGEQDFVGAERELRRVVDEVQGSDAFAARSRALAALALLAASNVDRGEYDEARARLALEPATKRRMFHQILNRARRIARTHGWTDGA